MKVYTHIDGALAVWESTREHYEEAQMDVCDVMQELGEQGPVLVLIEGGRHE